jgi:hypothetical protein
MREKDCVQRHEIAELIADVSRGVDQDISVAFDQERALASL